MSSNKIHVLLVEDEPFWQKQIQKHLESKTEDIQVVGIAACKEQVLPLLKSTAHIDVALVDLNLSRANLDGLDVIELLHKQEHHTRFPIIALTAVQEGEIIVQAFEAGAVNYVNKSCICDMITVIRGAAEGKIDIHHSAAAALLYQIRTAPKIQSLTASERDVYTLQRKGLNKQEIADALFKSISTVKKQLHAIKKKLGE